MIIKIIWILLYNLIFLPILFLILCFLYPFNDKIKRGLNDRKNLFKKINEFLKNLNKNNKNIGFIVHLMVNMNK